MNTAFVSITFQAKMAGWNWPQVTVQSSLTGTAPVITPSTTTAGVGIDPAVATASFRTSGTDMQTFRVRPNVDLVNDTYRAFVRVTDSGGLVSGWRYSEFVVNVTALNTPTITPTVLGGVSGISLLVHATTGAGLPAGSKFLVQYHDSDWDGTTWLNVRGCDALVPNGSGDATGVDLDARFGVLRSYRAITYLYDSTTDSFRGSAWSSTVTATLTPRNIWTLSRTTTTDVTVVSVRPDLEPEWTVNGASFTAQGRKYPIVLTDGVPKAPTFDLEINALTNAVRTTVTAMLQAGEPLLLRSPFGDEWYIKVFPKWSRKFLRATPLVSELTSIRDAAILKASVVSVKRPRVGPTAGPLIEA